MDEIKTMKELVDYAAAQYKEKAAYRYLRKKEVIEKTFKNVKEDSEAFARGLSRIAKDQEHVALIGPTSYEYLIAYFGTVNSGHVAVPLDKEQTTEEICSLIMRADVTVFVYDASYLDVAKKVKEKCPEVRSFVNMQDVLLKEFESSLWDLIEENRGVYERTIEPDSLASIVYTSGTTGKSKGVMLSHYNQVYNAVCVDMGIDSNTAVTLSVLPIHHTYCFTCDILTGLYFGVTVCMNDSMMHLVRNLSVFHPTIMLVVPMIAESILYRLKEAHKANPDVPKPILAKKALGGALTTVYCGGAYLNPAFIPEFMEYGIYLRQGYGMTESAPRISNNFQNEFKADSVGKLLPGVQVKVEDGEILVKSPSVMMGYYKDRENTEKTLKNGWLKTGDLGYVDQDDFLYISGRKKNLIILSNGENVSPEGIENRLKENQLVKEVLVYEEDNRITAEIYPDAEYARINGILDIPAAITSLVEETNRYAPAFQKVVKVKMREEEFPKTTSKKIRRKYVAESEK
ncbi:MAG: long-chain fatty acid--CoA ligase [Lachnospiraceae bacterium]|nr:long-chain fatty acid--CoA ligase [Lachnospiraceae bacterium]